MNSDYDIGKDVQRLQGRVDRIDAEVLRLSSRCDCSEAAPPGMINDIAAVEGAAYQIDSPNHQPHLASVTPGWSAADVATSQLQNL